jgi:hypothetical protein
MVSKTCAICNSSYMAKRIDAMYCSQVCKKIAYYTQNKVKELEKSKLWHKEHKEAVRAHARKYYQKNKGYYKAKRTNREKAIKQATPTWVDKSEFVKIYGEVPQGYHVDHIVPIKGSNVCGLHVPWNLQYLSATENLRKSNKV